MKSGLEDRNNLKPHEIEFAERMVSMKSGLEDRNNSKGVVLNYGNVMVSMKSGLEDRNNEFQNGDDINAHIRLNEVRPGRPEQSTAPGTSS